MRGWLGKVRRCRENWAQKDPEGQFREGESGALWLVLEARVGEVGHSLMETIAERTHWTLVRAQARARGLSRQESSRVVLVEAQKELLWRLQRELAIPRAAELR